MHATTTIRVGAGSGIDPDGRSRDMRTSTGTRAGAGSTVDPDGKPRN